MAQPQDKTILVAEDEPDVRYFLQTVLEDAGFHVVTAADGDEALAQVREKKPDLISLDLVMPRKSGVKFFRELRKDREWSHIPVLVVTAHARDEMGQRDLEEILAESTMSGPGIYLEKPIRPEAYVNNVKRILGLEVTEEESDTETLKRELQEKIRRADPEALQKALKALTKS
jgi:CheY-like chemotaxis protein